MSFRQELAQVKVSCVIPCYNEGHGLKQNIEELSQVITMTPFSWELIFVDDKSQDQTLALLENEVPLLPVPAQLIKNKENYGRGKTVTLGIEKARGEIVGFLDIDLEISPWYLPWFVHVLLQGADIAIACRTYRLQFKTIHRHAMTQGYRWLRKKVLGLPFEDTEGGFKFFRREKILPVLAKVEDTRWFWDTEILARAYLAGLKIVQIPVLFIKRADKASSVRVFPDTLDYIFKLFRFTAQLSPEERKKLKSRFKRNFAPGFRKKS